jgi:hypothetical protein
MGWGRCGERWLAHLEPAGEAFLACRLDGERLGGSRRSVRDFVGRWVRMQHRHAVDIESCVVDEGRDPWVVMPYTGDADGVVSLASLLVRRGGQLGVREAARCASQLLGLSADAHSEGLVHGRYTTDEVLVDRGGSLGVELYGLSAGFAHEYLESARASEADEVRSVVDMVFELATGVPSVLAGNRPFGLAGREGKRLGAWLEGGLSRSGYADAKAAMGALDT